MPVTIRNYSAGGEFVLITSGGGEVFYIGNNAEADGTYKSPRFVRPNPEFEHEDFRAEARKRTRRALSRKESSDFWFAEGKRFIKENPGAFAALLIKKTKLFFNYYEHADNQNYYFHRKHSRLLGSPLLHFGVVAPLGMLGFFLALRRFRKYGILHIVFLVYLVSLLLVFNFSRFRLPAVPFLIIFAVYFIRWFYESVKEKRVKYALVSLVPLFLFYYGMNYNLLKIDPYSHKFDVAYSSQGICYGEAGRTDEALASFKEAVVINPSYPAALVGLGTAYLRSGDVDAGVQLFIRATALAPTSPYAHFGLAEAYFFKGSISRAISQYKTAIRLDRNFYLARYKLALAYEEVDNIDAALGELKEYFALTKESERFPDSAAMVKRLREAQERGGAR